MKAKLVVASAIAVGLLMGAVLIANGSTPPRQSKSGASPGPARQKTAGIIFDPSRDDGPFLHSEKVSIEQADARAGFTPLRPDTPKANDGNVRNVFIEVTRDDYDTPWAQLAFDYDSGLLMLELPAWVDGMDKDPRKQYQEMAEGYPGSYARVTTVRGVPALVIERNDKGSAYVDLVIEGVRVELYGVYGPLEAADLIAVAESLK